MAGQKEAKAALSVTASALNVRAKASSKSKVIGTVTKGMTLQEIGQEGNWINASYGAGKEGWVYSRYVSRVKASDDTPNKATKPPEKTEETQKEEPSKEREGLNLARALAYNKARGLSRAQWKQIQQTIGVKPDGVVGPDTTRAVFDYQIEKGLAKPDGMAGPATQKAIGLKADPSGAGKDPETEQKESDGREDDGKESPPRGNITAHFSWQDFISAEEKKPVPKRYRPNVIALCKELEKLRAALGKPINITPNGGYREIRGVKNSQHKVGKAADMQVPGVSPKKVRQTIRSLVKAGKMRDGGIGGYPSFSHYDVGPARHWGSW